MIKFGTDGWRAVISEEFTFENVRIVAQAISDYLKLTPGAKRVIVGYDTRFLSDRYAQLVSEVLAGNGIKVILTDGPCPVPVACYTIKRLRLAGGVIVTASHNPPHFNGIKFKADYAGPGDPSITDKIEELVYKNEPVVIPFEKAKSSRVIEVTDVTGPYFEFIDSYIDADLLKDAGLKVLVDSMYGVGDWYLKKILEQTNCQVKTIHAEPDPLFGGLSPEPIPKNLGELVSLTKEGGFDVGLATDGDCDRIGVVRSNGSFVTPHWIISLLLLYLVKYRKWGGGVAKTICTTSLLRKLASKYGLPLYETPVGFKHISKLMRETDILIGGEESGGIGFKNYIPERDGFLSGLLILELIAQEKRNLIEIMNDMEKEFGQFHYMRKDTDYPVKMGLEVVEALKQAPPSEILDEKVAEINSIDGIKFICEDESWLLVRPSGTEPLLRIYAEAGSEQRVKAMVELGKELAFGIKR